MSPGASQTYPLLESPGGAGLSFQNQDYKSYEAEYSDDFSDGQQLTLPSNATDSPRIFFMKGLSTPKSRVSRVKSFTFAVFNTANTALGTGVLSFGFAFRQCGWALGLILCILSASLMGYALSVILKAARAYNCANYQDTVTKMFGYRAGQILTCILIIYNFMACISYLLVMGSQTNALFDSLGGPSFLKNQNVVMIIYTVLSTPFCVMKSIDALGPVSTLGVIAVFFFVGMIVYHAIDNVDHFADNVQAFNLQPRALQTIPIMFFALFCHIAIIPSCEELRDFWPSKHHRGKIRYKTLVLVCIFVMTICVSLYIPSGICGYLLFGENVQEDVLESFGKHVNGSVYIKDSWEVQVSKVCMVLTTFFGFPVLVYLNRGAYFDLMEYIDISSCTYYTFTLSHMALSTLLAIGCYQSGIDIGFIMSIVGSTAAVAIELVIPGLMLWKLNLKGQSICILILSFCVCILGLFVTIANKLCDGVTGGFCESLGY